MWKVVTKDKFFQLLKLDAKGAALATVDLPCPTKNYRIDIDNSRAYLMDDCKTTLCETLVQEALAKKKVLSEGLVFNENTSNLSWVAAVALSNLIVGFVFMIIY